MKQNKRIGATILTVVLSVISVIYVIPVVTVAINSFKANAFVKTETFALPTAESFVGWDNFITGITLGNYNFWEFQVQVKADPASMTFATEGVAANLVSECGVTIASGKVTVDGATTPSGMPADAIEFLLSFDDDPYGFTYKVHGFRYTGLAGDE